MTTDSIGKQIGMALTDMLSEIRTTNTETTYNTDIGQTVRRGVLEVDETLLPFINIKEADEVPAARDGNRSSRFLEDVEFRIEGMVKCDPDNPNDIGHDIVFDLKRCLFTKSALDEKFKALFGRTSPIKKITYKSRSILAREGGSKYSGGAITIGIEYVEDVAEL